MNPPNPDAGWADSVFSSAEIEELLSKWGYTKQDFENLIPIVIWFEPHRAKDFIHAVNHSYVNPTYAMQLLNFLKYIADVIEGIVERNSRE